MSFPITYPAVDGPGRLTEICTFRKSAISKEEFDTVYAEITKAVAQFPISRQGILATQTNDRQVVAMVADWTSAAEKDAFEPGPQYQSVKPHFGKIIDGANPTFACHHLVLPGGAGLTPKAGVYVVSHATVAAADQAAVATAYNEYLKAPSSVDFLAVAPSREDASVLVCLTGHKDAAAAEDFQASASYKTLQAAVSKVATATSSYTAEYESSLVY
ncbi:hypothetical protein SEUCBS139899_004284 [Sporothrix eucalyptigena]|uniref:ABM domain-containing protein n=1 Tax=Sporothrix eucalyptigena TaxID=1812306 RepID=A0ABP0BU74_9PEZI